MELKIRIEQDNEEIQDITNLKITCDIGTYVNFDQSEKSDDVIELADDSSDNEIEIVEKTSILQPLILFVTMALLCLAAGAGMSYAVFAEEVSA